MVDGHLDHGAVGRGRVGTDGVEHPEGALGILDRAEPDLQHGGPQVGLQPGRRAFGDDPPVVQHHQGVGQAIGLFEVLGGQQHRGPAPHQLLDDLPQVVAALGVETGGGLVQEQDDRPGHQCGGQVEPAAHATGIGLEDPVAGIFETELGEQLLRPAGHRRTAHVVEVPDHLQVLATGQVLVDGGVLPGQADDAAHQGSLLAHVVPDHPGSSAVRLEDGGQDAHGRRLARSVWTEEAEDGALGGIEAHSVEGAHGVLAVEGLLEGVDLDGVVHGTVVLSGRGAWDRRQRAAVRVRADAR